MLRFNPKTGDISFAPSTLGVIISGVFLFGAWMTKMQYDVSGWNGVSDKVARIEQILIYNHLDAPNITGELKWPVPSPTLPSLPAYASSPAAVTNKQESASGTP